MSNKFLRNVTVAASGIVGAQIINFLSTPIITRIYDPEGLGVLSLFMSVATLLIPVAALAYPLAIVLPKTNIAALRIVRISFFIALLFSVFLFLLFVFFGEEIFYFFDIVAMLEYIYIIPVFVFFGALQQIFQQWNIRMKLFSINSSASVVNALFVNGGKIIFGWLYPFATVLVWVSFLGQVFYSINLWIQCKSKNQIKRIIKNGGRAKKLIYIYRDFPVYRAPELAINAVSQSLIIVILASLYSPVCAGYYSLARMVVGFPVTLIGNAIGDVFYPRVNEIFLKKDDVFNFVFKSTIFLVIIGVVPFFIFFIFSEDIFVIFFGVEWRVAGTYAKWLSIWMLLLLVNVPCVKVLPVIGKQKFHLKFSCVAILLRLLVVFLGFKSFLSDVSVVALFSIAGALINILLVAIVLFCFLKR